jgi:class 3 adenylate cyclase/CHASE3 domain sensor protein
MKVVEEVQSDRTGARANGANAGWPRIGAPLQPLVDLVAFIKASVHSKLLAGFLVSALLLLGMAVLSLIVIHWMSQQVATISRLQEKIDRARQMEYLVTVQSHYRAMALLTSDDSNNDKIAAAKKDFTAHLDAVQAMSPSDEKEFFDRVREANDRFAASSAKVLGFYQAGNTAEAISAHLSEEHPVSHELEAAMRELERGALKEISDATLGFQSHRRLLTTIVTIFSAVSLATALLLGFVLSWAFVRPVRRIDHVLAAITAGNFDQRVEVSNRDEFGTLGKNLNLMTSELARLYAELKTLNTNLQETVAEQVGQIERASMLRRYLSPQLADSILSGSVDVTAAPRRKNLTIFFSDIRGFTAMSERLEPEELVDHLNMYLTAMTDIVFKWGGTLDKYIGDAIMVFFGDPVVYEDDAERAVRMALEMRIKLGELQKLWFVREEETLTIGMGISTGYVTVGNIGSANRLEYTVIGNHVNLASRLASRASAGQILVSERTLVSVRDIVEAKEIDEIELKGVSRPTKIYEIKAREVE